MPNRCGGYGVFIHGPISEATKSNLKRGAFDNFNPLPFAGSYNLGQGLPMPDGFNPLPVSGQLQSEDCLLATIVRFNPLPVSERLQ